MKISNYSKFIVGFIGAIVTWALATFPDNHDVQVYISLVSALVTAFTIYAVPNTPVEGSK